MADPNTTAEMVSLIEAAHKAECDYYVSDGTIAYVSTPYEIVRIMVEAVVKELRVSPTSQG